MNRVTFGSGLLIAFLCSTLGSIGFFALSQLFSGEFALRLLISFLTSGYLFYLLGRSYERIGRITIALGWIILLAALWVFYLQLPWFLAVHVFAVWLLRSLYFYSSLLPSVADLGLNALATAAAFWAFHHTGSLFLMFWCFFLVQALFVFIPSDTQRLCLNGIGSAKDEADFQRAYRAAEAAVRKLSSNN